MSCDAQVTQLARLLASQMTAAGIGAGAQTKGLKPSRVFVVLLLVLIILINAHRKASVLLCLILVLVVGVNLPQRRRGRGRYEKGKDWRRISSRQREINQQ